jgi:lipid-binding SYLF domain-containing protein
MGEAMPTRRTLILIALLSYAAAPTGAQEDEVAARRQEIDAQAQATLDELFAERESTRELFDKAVGYAVFTATKAGFLVTGGAGTGVAVDKMSGQRTYMRMGTGGIGLGIGAQRYSLVILFQDQGQLDRFVQGGWDARTTAEAAAGQEGAAVTSSFVGGVAIFQLTSKGLMAQADVSGTRFWRIDDLN